MQRAALAALRVLRGRWPQARRIAVACGGGNNGGDGYLLAVAARRAGLAVRVLAMVEPEVLQGDAALAVAAAREAGLTIEPFQPGVLAEADVVVDALLGIGVHRPLRSAVAAGIGALNACGRPVLALDLPSGLDPDTGEGEAVVRATATVCFIALKAGLWMGMGPESAGTVHFDDLGVPALVVPPPVLHRLTDTVLDEALPPRRRDAHKGDAGHVLVVGGAAGMPGAVRLAAVAALRAGAGRVTVASRPEHLDVIVGGQPELMFRALPDTADGLREALLPLLQACDVVAIGPGLGRAAWGHAVWQVLWQWRRGSAAPSGSQERSTGQPWVIDADALWWLAAEAPTLRQDEHGVLTPHPGEAARLLGCSVAQVQRDRRAAAQALSRAYGGTVVLKGAGSLVSRQGEVTALCERGNPGMAVAGMGDVLTGTVAALLGQCADPWLAVRAAVQAHALAGDRVAAEGGQRGLLAGEVAAALRGVVNGSRR
jgi:ADP-dependent NAD(P)H-hydrate dehydratase / NAD(P)H-hydrate epimerase